MDTIRRGCDESPIAAAPGAISVTVNGSPAVLADACGSAPQPARSSRSSDVHPRNRSRSLGPGTIHAASRPWTSSLLAGRAGGCVLCIVRMPRVLLTGATGFVGRSVRPALLRADWQVRGLSRDVRRARDRWPDVEWVEGDVGDPAVCTRALAGCDAALYLVHAIGEGSDFRRREVEAARTFAAAAAAVPSMRRIVYLGGVAPRGRGSEHLQSRLEVGEALRAGRVSTIELRASMIVGHGSLSWLVVRDLAARLPVMVLPRWLRSQTEPVAIDDVVVALVRALELEQAGSAWFDIPGPDVLTGKQILEETARVMGLRRPRSLDVPLLTPHLSSLWVRFVTRADWSVARNIVIGLTHDLLAQSDRFWALIDHRARLSFAEAARRALAAEEREGVPVRGPWGVVERVLAAH